MNNTNNEIINTVDFVEIPLFSFTDKFIGNPLEHIKDFFLKHTNDEVYHEYIKSLEPSDFMCMCDIKIPLRMFHEGNELYSNLLKLDPRLEMILDSKLVNGCYAKDCEETTMFDEEDFFETP